MNSWCITTIFFAILSVSFAANCYGPASKLAVTEFNAFPSPVEIGGTLFVRANIKPKYNITKATVQISVYYTDNFDVTGVKPLVTIPGLDFCALSTTFSCPLQAVSNILSWQYTVPSILPGTYQVRYTITEDNPPDGNPYSCIQFPITVDGAKTNSFTSQYSANLIGTAVFSEADYKQRQIGQNVQVGPSGPLNFSTPGYGSLKGLQGSGDLVPNAFYDTSNFVWGMSGTMTKQSIGPKGQLTHIYQGNCFLGYINNDRKNVLGNFYDYDTPLLEGDFYLNWTYKDSSTALITGYVDFTPSAVIPTGWGFPLLYGRIQRHTVSTSNVGFLMIQGILPFCPNGLCESPPSSDSKKGGHGLSSGTLALIIVPILGFALIALVAFAIFRYVRRRRESEAEDGIFAVARKPEYGSALVVDDIIEESRGSKTLQAMIDINEGGDDDSGSDSESDRSRSVSRSVSRSGSPSRSRSGSRSQSRGMRSGEDSAGESASRDSDSD